VATKRKKDYGIVVKASNKRSLSQRPIKPKTRLSSLKLLFHLFPIWAYEKFYNSVLRYFRTVNRKAGKTIELWLIKAETLQHVDSIVKVFKWIVVPASLIYVLASFSILKENALDSTLLGVAFFFYSNFLPDIPAIFRGKHYEDLKTLNQGLPGYKKYALLLFAPLFIALFLCGIKLGWKTTETFHNLKSLAIYTGFLSIIGFLIFASLPIGIGDAIETISLPLFGLAGYLTHLKVDLCM